MKKLALIFGCILYVLSPIDIVPDVLVGLGQLDDIAAIVWTVKKLMGGKE